LEVALNKTRLLLIFMLLFGKLAFAEQSIIEVIPLANRPASEIQPLLAPLLDSGDHVIANGSNLVVKTTPQRLTEIRALVSELDTRLNNLVITVMQSRRLTAEELNAAARVRISGPIDDLSKARASIHGYYSQAQDQYANESTQTIRTLEGNTAYIQAGSAHPTESVQIYDPGYGPTVSTTTGFIETTTGFAVTPRLSGEQAILDVSPWSDKLNTRGQVETQNAQTTIRVKLGEWVELGGINEASQRSDSGNLARIRQTSQGRLRILVKVDKID
jgi:type II secretory pathway component GspD/PulD (secretin)